MECAADEIRRFRKQQKKEPTEARSVTGGEGIFSWHPSGYQYSVAAALIEERVSKLRCLASEEVGSEAGSIADEIMEQRAWLRKVEQSTWNSIVELYFLLSDVRQDLLRIRLVNIEAKLGFQKDEAVR
jgi:hypothetical protein